MTSPIVVPHRYHQTCCVLLEKVYVWFGYEKCRNSLTVSSTVVTIAKKEKETTRKMMTISKITTRLSKRKHYKYI